ncbi:MAG: response regulator [Yoonia sp.]|uniref:response regulator n=1 Tax=Yoonia sp. TaxID=2212373 RepID=UPI003EF20DAF
MTEASTILIIEDNDDDYEACVSALTLDGNLANGLDRCETGDEALDYLLRRGNFSGENAPARPGLILLDLNLPGTDGREVLAEIKNHDELKAIPVVIMTTSGDDTDIESCYRDGANSYVVKPIDLEGFYGAINRLREYWFEIVVLPENRLRHG